MCCCHKIYAIITNKTSPDSDKKVDTVFNAFKFLMGGYEPEYVWYEFVILLRKMLMACMSVFRLHSPALHSGMPLAVCTIFLVVHARFAPFADDRLDVLEFFALAKTA